MSLVSSVFSGLLTAVENDEEAAVLPELSTLFTNVSLNPSLANFVAQGNLFLANALASQGTIGQDALKDIASTLAVAAQKVANPPAPTPAASASSDSTAPATPAPAAAAPPAATPSAGASTAAFLAARAAIPKK